MTSSGAYEISYALIDACARRTRASDTRPSQSPLRQPLSTCGAVACVLIFASAGWKNAQLTFARLVAVKCRALARVVVACAPPARASQDAARFARFP